MVAQTVCPRCGARDSFLKGYLAETCVCRVCQSQLDWREIPGCGPDCRPVDQSGSEETGGTSTAAEDPTGGVGLSGDRPSNYEPASGSDA